MNGPIGHLPGRVTTPTARQLLDQLPEIGDGLARRLRQAEHAPEVALLDGLVRDAAGLVPYLMRVRELVIEEAAAGGTPGA